MTDEILKPVQGTGPSKDAVGVAVFKKEEATGKTVVDHWLSVLKRLANREESAKCKHCVPHENDEYGCDHPQGKGFCVPIDECDLREAKEDGQI